MSSSLSASFDLIIWLCYVVYCLRIYCIFVCETMYKILCVCVCGYELAACQMSGYVLYFDIFDFYLFCFVILWNAMYWNSSSDISMCLMLAMNATVHGIFICLLLHLNAFRLLQCDRKVHVYQADTLTPKHTVCYMKFLTKFTKIRDTIHIHSLIFWWKSSITLQCLSISHCHRISHGISKIH